MFELNIIHTSQLLGASERGRPAFFGNVSVALFRNEA